MPDRLSDSPGKVASPETVATEVVPESVAPPGLVLIDSTTVCAGVVTRFPAPSCTRTLGEGVIAAPATTALGSCTNATAAALPAASVIAADVSGARLPEVKRIVRGPIVPVRTRLLKVDAPPATVGTVSVPVSVPPPDTSAATMFVPLVLTALPDTSCSWTTVAGAIAIPLCAVAGGAVVIASRVGDPRSG